MVDERRRRLSPNVAASLVLALVAGAILLWQQPWAGADERDENASIPADASTQLTKQFRAMTAADDESSFIAAFGSGTAAATFARTTWTSLQALGARDVGLRYISGGEVADSPDGSARAVAEVSWRPGSESGLRASTEHRSSVEFRVKPQADGGVAIIGAAPRTTLLPIWLMGAVAVERRAGSVVITIDGGQAGTPMGVMAAQARATVLQTLPNLSGQVVVVSPRTPKQMAQAVGQKVEAVGQIAAVTTRLDVAAATARDAVIVLNPAVFETMDQRAAQIVVSHEATHQLTGAVGTRAETWVVEGFADYVALRDDKAPLSASAGQILAEVTAGRLPDKLPDATAFDAAGHGLGAVYESSWMIFRMLAEQHGNARVVQFYQSVLDGHNVPDALRDAFGVTEKQLTRQWQNYLMKSASTVS